jgi:hypothetical protein
MEKFTNLSINSTNLFDNQPYSYMDYFHPKFPKFLTIIFLLIGDFGNILSFFVFSKPSMRNNSVFIYFAFLSIIDFFVITLGLGDIIIISYFGIVLRNESIIICRLHTFLTYFFTHLSSFVLASVSIDRAIALNSIQLSKIYCKPKMAKKVILFNFLLVFIINFHSLFFLGFYDTYDDGLSSSSSFNTDILQATTKKLSLDAESVTFMCASREDSLYFSFLEKYFKYADLICYAFLPFAIMIVCTILIVRVLILSTNKFKKNNGFTVKRKRNRQVTYSLILLNILFLCLVSPLVFVLAFIHIEQNMDSKIVYNIIYLLAYSNHCFNFIFYGISCPPYRSALMALFGFRKDQQLSTLN